LIDRDKITDTLFDAGLSGSEVVGAMRPSPDAKGLESLRMARDRLTDREKTQADPVALEEQRIRDQDAQRVLAGATKDAQLDADEKIAGLRLKGITAEASMFEFARQRLRVELERQNTTQEIFDINMRLLDEQERRARELAAERIQEARDTVALDQAAQRRESAINAGDFNGASEAQASMDALQEKLAAKDAAKQADEIFGSGASQGKDEFIQALEELRKAILADRDAVRKRAIEEARSQSEQSKADRDLEQARRTGGLGKAEAKVDRLAYAAFEKQVLAEAAARFPNDQAGFAEFFETKMREFDDNQTAASDERKRQRAKAMEDVATDAKLADLNTSARVAELSGKTEEARRLREEAAKIEESRIAKNRAEELIGLDQTPEQAAKQAERERRLSVANRRIDDLANMDAGKANKIVASSLQSVGGGGGVYAVNNELDLARKRTRLLEEIRDSLKATRGPAELTFK
jgi:hypothetical protein